MELKSLHSPVISKQLIGRFGGISAYRVNGEQVRSLSVDHEEFNESANHKMLPKVVPPNEIWIEDTVVDAEIPTVVAGMLADLMSGNYDVAKKTEKLLRANKLDNGSIYVARVGKVQSVTVFLINAKIVRDSYKCDFALGGNHQVYDWIPENEIWLDSNTHPSELPYVALHEFVERKHMLELGCLYERAHAVATQAVWKAKNAKQLPDAIVQCFETWYATT